MKLRFSKYSYLYLFKDVPKAAPKKQSTQKTETTKNVIKSNKNKENIIVKKVNLSMLYL